MLLALAGCEKWELDRRMEELCKKDGGVRVFEHVRLPKQRFDEHGEVKPVLSPDELVKDPGGRYGPDFRLITSTEWLKAGESLKGQGRLRRTEYQLVRVADGKVLGVAVRYGRTGGDFVAYAHPSSASCPEPSRATSIEAVFVIGE
jgi:hypothetical protein